MKDNKLTLDKDCLVRLQDDQLEAASGGAAEGQSIFSRAELGADAITETAEAEGSCCFKSCRG